MTDRTLPRMLTIREAAKVGPLTEHALRILLRQGDLPGIYVGTKFLINHDALVRMLDQKPDGRCTQ